MDSHSPSRGGERDGQLLSLLTVEECGSIFHIVRFKV